MTSRYEQIRCACQEFHDEHPEVWRLFEKFTLDRISHGFEHYSADAIMHRVRWETDSGDSSRRDGFKINSNFVAFYARRFMRLHPRHDGFFRTRRQVSKDEQPRGRERAPTQ